MSFAAAGKALCETEPASGPVQATCHADGKQMEPKLSEVIYVCIHCCLRMSREATMRKCVWSCRELLTRPRPLAYCKHSSCT